MEDIIKSFRDICGVDVITAESCLKASSYDLLRAVNTFMDGGRSQPLDENVEPGYPEYAQDEDDEDDVRPPIAPKREMLVHPGEDIFQRRKRRAADQTIDPFRNFQREGALLEEELQTMRLNGPKKDRLSDLYLPSRRITFHGSFLEAKDYAAKLNKWLVVNLQCMSQFKSQLLNRDIWSHDSVVECMRNSFVLWQVNNDTEDGARFKSFYGVDQYPYVCILDPRTGEAKAKYPKICSMSAIDVASDLLMFIGEHKEHPNMDIPTDNEAAEPQASNEVISRLEPGPSRTYGNARVRAAKRKATSTEVNPQNVHNNAPSSSVSSASTSARVTRSAVNGNEAAVAQTSKKSRITRSSQKSAHQSTIKKEAIAEQPQHKKVIVQTIGAPPATVTSQSKPSPSAIGMPSQPSALSSQHVDNNKPSTSKKLPVASTSKSCDVPKSGEETRLQIRFNDDQPPKIISVPSDTTLADLVITLKQYTLPKCFKLVCPFVAKNLCSLDDGITMKEAGLHPSSVIHVMEDDDE